MSSRDRRGDSRRGRGRSRDDEFEEERWDDDDYADEPPAPRRRPGARGGRRPSGRGRSERKGFLGLFGGGGSRRGVPPRSRERFDWSAIDDEGAEEERYDERYEDEPRQRSRRRARRPAGPGKLTLMQLCTPVFGYAALLPQQAGEPQPTYKQFRDEVLAALKKVQDDASRHGIEAEDARLAAYALSLFMDEQVFGSEWTAKSEWITEPLGIVLQQDPEGGVNFFRRMEELGDRQKAVREVFLVCLALGFRGKYAELDPTQQASQIGEIRQKLVRSIHPVPLEKQSELFPDGYLPAQLIEDEVPPPPRWWVVASFGAVILALVVYFILFWVAGRTSEPASEAVAPLVAAATDVAAATPGEARR